MAGKLAGHTALVTGASSGIGADVARVLARQGAALVLVARRAEALHRLADELRRSANADVTVQPADLADEADRTALASEAGSADILVNNAGLGVYGPFADAPWEQLRRALEVNVVALTHLTHLFLPGMRRAGWGRILQVASTAAFQPTPGYAVYGAGKAQVLSFGIALNHELRGSGVTCTTLCPGTTKTEFFGVAGQTLNRFQRATAMSSAAVARVGVNAMIHRRPYVVAGRANALSALGGRLLPPVLTARLAALVLRRGASAA